MFRFLLIFCLALHTLQAWTHLELGAGNYGQLRESKNSNVQYRILFWTLEELVDRYGNEGTIYINDINEASADYAKEKLEEYLLMQGYEHILIETLIGDFHQLTWDGPQFDSIHLKNPEPHFYKDPANTRDMLQKFANYSKDGLFLFILYKDTFVPKTEQEEFMEKRIFYNETDAWDPVIYYSPHGSTIEGGRVFLILPSS